jgi:hypothetical protein
MLATLAEVKGKLGIPTTDTSRDSDLTLVLQAAGERILDLTRCLEGDATRVDLHRNVRLNHGLLLEKRPVSAVTRVEGRGLGMTGWVDLSYDLLDAGRGEIVLLGAGAWWPPTSLQPEWFRRWRNPEWPLVRVTYQVTGLGSADGSPPEPPQDIRDAVASLAAYWYRRDLANAAEASSIGEIREEWLSEAVPAWALARLARYLERGLAAWA